MQMLGKRWLRAPRAGEKKNKVEGEKSHAYASFHSVLWFINFRSLVSAFCPFFYEGTLNKKLICFAPLAV